MMRWSVVAVAVAVTCTSPGGGREPERGREPGEGRNPGGGPGTGSDSAQLLSPGDYTFSLTHDGRTRSYRVHVPRTLPSPAPVLLAFHGGGGSAAQFQQSSGFDENSEKNEYVVVFPDGTGAGNLHTWNVGGCCGFALNQGIDDVGFVRALVADLGQRLEIDEDRIYATGHSNGSMMAHRLAAEAADLVAAIAPYAGAPYFDLLGFAPSRPVPVLHIHSRDDPRALYDGGLGPPFPLTNVRTRMNPVEEQLEYWIRFDGCPESPTVGPTVRGKPGTFSEGHTATTLVWAPCAEGTEVRLLRLTGSGHGWPGRNLSRLRERLLGPGTDVIDIEEEIWGFVSRFSR